MAIHCHDALFVLNGLRGVGPVSLKRLLEAFDNDPVRVLEASKESLKRVEGVGPSMADAIHGWASHFDLDGEKKKMQKQDARFVAQVDDDYPDLLKQLWDAPVGLYWKGPYVPEQNCVAIIGSRRCTLYGIKMAKQLAAELASRGICIVSGLARGIDSAAHEGALEVGGKTIGVLGCGLDIIYPPENYDLYKAVWGSGAVISEFPFGRRADKQTFPMRNRIVAGMSRAVIVVESDVRGGSMITARFAADQGRHLFAVPGRVDQVASRGCHALIRDGATLVSSAEEVLEELDYGHQMELLMAGNATPKAPHLDPEEASLWQFLQENGAASIDEIAHALSLQVAGVAGLALRTELKGAITKKADGKYESLS